MKLIGGNLKKVFLNKISFLASVLSFLAMIYLFNYFASRELVIGNLGYNFYLTELSFDILIAILFGLFVGSTVYKMNYFSKTDKKNTILGGIGGFFGVLITGCPACSITLASYLGLASIISVFPFYGMELKVLSLALLLYVVYDTLKSLEVCKVKIKK
ncbi:MAG: hypothetical protein PHS49_03765 [Candidatus Gracilibacteria bacterium]|nr:hypothetical protein [Candidatus Gracilibacteria bacterium]